MKDELATVVEKLNLIIETLARLESKLEDIDYRQERLDEAIANISTPGRDYDTYSVDEL